MEPGQAPSSSPYQPPGAPYEQLIRQKKSWPTVIGVICLVFAVIVLGTSALGMSQQEKAMPTVPAEVWERHHLAVKVDPYLAIGLAALAVIGSILLIQRKRVGWTLLLAWAVLKIGYAVGLAPARSALMKEIAPYQSEMALKQMKGAPGKEVPSEEDVKTIMTTAMDVMLILVTLWLCALPVFLLIWSLSKKVRAEVASWGGGPAPPAFPPPIP